MERESRTIEYKRTIGDFQKLARTVVAFANGDGGRVVIGVEDRSRAIVGLAPETVDSLLERIPVSLADQIQPPVFPQLFEQTIDGKGVLVVQVFPANQKPCFIASEGIEKGVYIRVGAHTRRAQGELLEELRLLRSHIGYDEAPLPQCPVGELDMGALPAGMRSEKALHSLGVFRYDTVTGKPMPVRGAVLVLHPSPERYIAEAYIVVSRMRGDHGRSTVESHDLKGSAPQQADAALALLEQWLGRDTARHGARYVAQRFALPMDAVREAVTNAVFHRQYSIPGPIKIALYASRLEIFSPGHFAGPFIPEALGDGTSYIRNRVMCTLARRLGLVEKRGTGLRLIQDSMSGAGLQVPVFSEGAQWFKVTLPLDRAAAAGKPDSGDAVMQLLEGMSSVRSADICAKLGISKATAVGILNRLVTQGKLRKAGAGPQTRYLAAV